MYLSTVDWMLLIFFGLEILQFREMLVEMLDFLDEGMFKVM